MRMSEKCPNNNSDNLLTSRRTDGGENVPLNVRQRRCNWYVFFFSLQYKRGPGGPFTGWINGHDINILVEEV